MRQHKVLTWSLLVLSIINFALAAPAAVVRGRLEVRLDANVTRNVTTPLQKRWDSLDGRGSPNVPEPDHALPPIPDTTDMGQMLSIPWSQISDRLGEQHRHRRTDSPSSSSNYVPPSPGSATGSRLPMGLMPDLNLLPVADSLSPPFPSPHPAPSEDHSPGPPGFPAEPDRFLSTSNHYASPGPEYSTGSRLPVGSMLDLNLPAVAESLSPPPPPWPRPGGPSHPWLSEDRSPGPPGFSAVNPDTFSSTRNHPTIPQSPGFDSKIHALLNPGPVPTELEFWDKLFKGGIKRRMSRSDAVDLAQKDPRSRIF
jgi:hypothetical protein